MKPTETLKHEHDVILMVLDAGERAAGDPRGTLERDPEFLDKLVDFIRNFADRCHHGKEEANLFERMQERGIPKEGGPIGVMLLEHEEGRAHVKAIAEAIPAAKQGDEEALEQAKTHLLGYIELLRNHIAKENEILYPLADTIFTAEDQQWLEHQFECVEAQEMGEGVHERYHELAHELAGE